MLERAQIFIEFKHKPIISLHDELSLALGHGSQKNKNIFICA